MSDPALPAAFADLAPLLPWALPTETQRAKRRREASYEVICAFYELLQPRLAEALGYLDTLELEALPPPERRLYDICLAFAEIAPYVEQYHRTTIPETFDEGRFVALHDLPRGTVL